MDRGSTFLFEKGIALSLHEYALTQHVVTRVGLSLLAAFLCSPDLSGQEGSDENAEALQYLTAAWNAPRPDQFDVRIRITKTVKRGDEIRPIGSEDHRVIVDQPAKRASYAVRTAYAEQGKRSEDHSLVKETLIVVRGSVSTRVATGRMLRQKRDSYLQCLEEFVPFHPMRVGFFEPEMVPYAYFQDHIDEICTNQGSRRINNSQGRLEFESGYANKSDPGRWAKFRWVYDPKSLFPVRAVIRYANESTYGISLVLDQRTVRNAEGLPVLQTADEFRFGDPFGDGERYEYRLISDVEYDWSDPKKINAELFDIPDNVEERISGMLKPSP